MRKQRDFVEAMAKHLPPSASALHLLDVGSVAGDVLQEMRGDLMLHAASMLVEDWQVAPASVDAVVAYDRDLPDDFLAAVLAAMRPGGRFIMVHPVAEVDEAYGQTLEAAGYVRILVEPALENGEGVLVRGEKPHTTADTLARVRVAASLDDDALDLSHFRGRYVHVLVRQSPNKPVWKLTPDEIITWQAVAIPDDAGRITLLAFSSLPKAVAFLQAAVLQNVVRDVNKVGKFSKATAHLWTMPVMLNPTIDVVVDAPITWVSLDAMSAEAPDE